jgi:O-antigen/teichoic acid export membrane protein
MSADRSGPGSGPASESSDDVADGERGRGSTSGRTSGPPSPPTRAESYYFGEGRGAGPRARRPNWDTGDLDGGSYERQMAGIRALTSLGYDVAAMPRTGGDNPPPVDERPRQDRSGVISRLRQSRAPGPRAPATRAESYYFGEDRGAGTRARRPNWDTGELDAGSYERQMAGIRALTSLGYEVAAIPWSTEDIPSPVEGRPKQGRLSVISRLRQDEMTWNSLFLIMSTGLQSGTGFLFWIITARLFSVSDVGKGSALISGAGLIGILSLIGLNSGMGRYLPNARNRDALISSGLTVVAVLGALGGLLYILLTPLIAPQLAFVERSPVLLVGFALVTSLAAVNTLTDVIFVASRKAKYTTFVDGVLGGIGKLALVAVLTGAGAYGLFLASAIGTALAALSSLFLIITAMHVRLDLRGPLETLKPLLRFSGANYLGTVMNVLTILIVPIILLDRLGATPAGYFFVILQMAQIVYTAALALESTFLTEGSRADADMRHLRRRSLRLLVLFFVLSAVILIGAGRWLLLAFGQPYYHYGYTSLIILVLAAGPISANYWLQTVLRLAGKLQAIIVVNIVGAIATCGCVWIGSSHGLTGVSWGWLAGALITTCVAAAAAREGRPASSR